MKSRSVIIAILILSLVVVPGLQMALAASSTTSTKTSTTTTTASTSTGPKSPYFEKLDVYTVGYNSYWQVSLSPVNATKSGVVAAESVAGVSAYQLTAIDTGSATQNSLLFWADGYNVQKLPFIPASGVFLNITATDQTAAQSAASDFDTLLGTNFIPIGSGGGNYTFFAAAAFTTAGPILFGSVPVAKGGLAAMTSESALSALPTPTETLIGVRSGSSFTHTVQFGSTQSGIITNSTFANSTLVLADALGAPNATFAASTAATSTHVIIHSLDGLIVSSDKNATIANHQGNYSGSYSISVAPGATIDPNVTLLESPPVLTATRTLDTGSVTSGGLVSLTLQLTNTAQVGTISDIKVNDSWWKAYPTLLASSAGNWSFTDPSLGAGLNYTQVYALKVTSSAANDLTIPAAKISYSYTLRGVTVNETTATNQDELRTNSPGPALIIQAGADIDSGAPVGTTAHYVVRVSNVGDGAALNLQVGNFTDPTLTQGSVWKFNTTIPLTSIVNRNYSQTFTLTWTAPDGGKGTLVSNPFQFVMSHSSIIAPTMQFTLTGTVSPSVFQERSMNLSYALTNIGSASSTGANVTQTLPPGMTCVKVLNGTATCTSTGFTVTAVKLGSGASSDGKVALNFSNDNYQVQPAMITAADQGVTLHTAGNTLIVPAGILVTKTFATSPVFQGQTDNVTVNVANQGSLPVYNLSVTAQSDSFDSATSGATLHQTYATLGPNATQSFSYVVNVNSAGNHTGSTTSTSFVFGGASQSDAYPSSGLLIYSAIKATTTTSPSTPTEGEDFVLTLSVQNPSTVNVTNVSVQIPIPKGVSIVGTSGLTVTDHNLTLTLPSLAAGASSTQTVTLKSASDGTISIQNGVLTFQYSGQTVKGIVVAPSIAVGVDILLHFEIPVALAVLIAIGIAVYVHRKLPASAAK